MARGDECKTTSKANSACKNLDVIHDPFKKQAASSTASSYKQQQAAADERKSYGAWGPIFKDKKSFLDMHHC